MNSQYRQIDSNPHKKFKTSPQITSIIGGSQMSMCISEKKTQSIVQSAFYDIVKKCNMGFYQLPLVSTALLHMAW